MIGLTFPALLQSNADISTRVNAANMSWATASDDFYNAAFLGDGVQGATALKDTLNPSHIRLLFGHYKAITYRSIPNWEYCESRVFAGSLMVKPRGTASAQPTKMDMNRGLVTGTIQTDLGEVKWRSFAERRHHVLVLVASGTGQERSPEVAVRPEWGITPRIYADKRPIEEVAQFLPSKPKVEREGDFEFVLNPMATRGAHVVASYSSKLPDGNRSIIVAVGTSSASDPAVAIKEAKADALERVTAAKDEGINKLESRHYAWWKAYWHKGGISLPDDPYWEKFWYQQLYKFASASSDTDSLVIDTCGPWIWNSGWAAVWWNLNVQLSYMPAYGSNRLEVGRSLLRGIERMSASGNLRRNAGDQPGIMIGRSTTYLGSGSWGDEISNLTWALHNVWRDWASSRDEGIARRLYPLLKESVAYMTGQLSSGPDGRLHARPARSPEYNEKTLTPDANYVLMTVDWGLQALIELNRELQLKDPDEEAWKSTLQKLAPFPKDEHGFRVSSELGFAESHRHYSHLLAIYPYHTIHPEQGAEARTLIEKSVDRWLGLKGGHAGYTFSGGAAMLATLGKGDRALETLDELKPRLTPNTMYREGSPVVETPLSAVDSLNYFLLQSWGGTLRVFPAMPARWRAAAFRDLRAEGAFLVSASWRNGQVENLSIKSEAGGKCRLRNPWPTLAIEVRSGNRAIKAVALGADLVFPTTKGSTYQVRPVKDLTSG